MKSPFSSAFALVAVLFWQGPAFARQHPYRATADKPAAPAAPTFARRHPSELRWAGPRHPCTFGTHLRSTAPARATAGRPSAPIVSLIFQNTTRAESWSFFTPPVGGGNPDYSLLSNRATLGMRVSSRRLDVFGAFRYSQAFDVPRDATGIAGALGPGGMYFDAARARAAYQLYFKALSLRLRDIVPGLSIEVGRMRFASGAEAVSTSEEIETIKRLRLSERLLGAVEWSTFERAFDGGRVDLDRSRWSANAALLFPTQGAFEESASPTMGSLRVLTSAWTLKTPGRAQTSSHASELQLFALHYRDHRDVHGRPDNTGLSARHAEISVATVGGSHLGVYPAGPGQADSLLWIARQSGDWYGGPHRATSALVEGGYQWQSAGRPWIRGGWLYASGDDNPADRTHGTFFPMLPSSRPALLAGTFAQMNIHDTFAQLRVQPHTRVAIDAEVHRLSLANAADRWYAGTGATAFKGRSFGYTGRSSRLTTSLGTLFELSAEAALSSRWTMRASVGTVNGGEVVRRLFVGNRLTVVSLESAFSF